MFDDLTRTQSDYAKLMKARRMATRQRAEAACLPCKAKKAKCSDFRPCARCSQSLPANCVDSMAFQPASASSLTRFLNPVMQHCLLPFDFSSSHGFGPLSEATNMGTTTSRQFFNDQTFVIISSPRLQLEPKVYLQQSEQQNTGNEADQHSSTGCPSTHNTFIASSNSYVQWAWEAAAGPGNEDPFHDDLKRCERLWVQDDMTSL